MDWTGVTWRNRNVWEGNKVGRGNERWVARERVKSEYFSSMSSHCASGIVG